MLHLKVKTQETVSVFYDSLPEFHLNTLVCTLCIKGHQAFSVKGQTVNIFSLVVTWTLAQAFITTCAERKEPQMIHKQIAWLCANIQLYLQKQRAGWIWPLSDRLLISYHMMGKPLTEDGQSEKQRS